MRATCGPGRRAWGRPRRKLWACKANWRVGTRACAEPHRKHVVYVCDAGRVEAQRLVERRRALPSPKGGIP
eukprot:scaffold38171_cov50-Phaeocystis_antarctica.AAC.10